jgi:hypothetical protein
VFHKIKFDNKSGKRKETGEYYHKRVISVVICDLELLKRLTLFQIYIKSGNQKSFLRRKDRHNTMPGPHSPPKIKINKEGKK